MPTEQPLPPLGLELQTLTPPERACELAERVCWHLRWLWVLRADELDCPPEKPLLFTELVGLLNRLWAELQDDATTLAIRETHADATGRVPLEGVWSTGEDTCDSFCEVALVYAHRFYSTVLQRCDVSVWFEFISGPVSGYSEISRRDIEYHWEKIAIAIRNIEGFHPDQIERGIRNERVRLQQERERSQGMTHGIPGTADALPESNAHALDPLEVKILLALGVGNFSSGYADLCAATDATDKPVRERLERLKSIGLVERPNRRKNQTQLTPAGLARAAELAFLRNSGQSPANLR